MTWYVVLDEASSPALIGNAGDERARAQLHVDRVAVARRVHVSSGRAPTARSSSCARICATCAYRRPTVRAELLPIACSPSPGLRLCRLRLRLRAARRCELAPSSSATLVSACSSAKRSAGAGRHQLAVLLDAHCARARAARHLGDLRLRLARSRARASTTFALAPVSRSLELALLRPARGELRLERC